jgi:hypothetical protein
LNRVDVDLKRLSLERPDDLELVVWYFSPERSVMLLSNLMVLRGLLEEEASFDFSLYGL